MSSMCEGSGSGTGISGSVIGISGSITGGGSDATAGVSKEITVGVVDVMTGSGMVEFTGTENSTG